jgi:hypothetical protein
MKSQKKKSILKIILNEKKMLSKELRQTLTIDKIEKKINFTNHFK